MADVPRLSLGSAALDSLERAIALPTVLVVEDDRDIRQLVALYLRRKGLNVVTACNALEAVAAIEVGRPDLVLLDIMLPGHSGLELLEDLRLQGNQVPVVMLTALCTPGDIARGYELGADDYIAKPFSREVLMRRVRRLVDTSHLDAATLAFDELLRLAAANTPDETDGTL
jgi:two-component system OmpR family response regulator